jgi:hypothetical protein
MVTCEELGERVREWGGDAQVVHEAPPPWTVGPARPLAERPRVLFVGIFAADEPMEPVMEAARLLPEMDMLVTGNLEKAPPGLVESAPPNVTFTGFLDETRYPKAIEEANLVWTLTSFPVSVPRTGYEAVYARRPLLISDWPELRDVFPHAVHVQNEGAAIAAGIRDAITRYDELVSKAPEAEALQRKRWESQLAAVRSWLGAGQ